MGLIDIIARHRSNSATAVAAAPTVPVSVTDDRAWAAEQAQKQMDYQTQMSNTAYQRAVADMRQAGLNPALAYQQGGATAPSGALAATSSTVQNAALTRENNNYKVLTAMINGVFGLANSALKVAK